ncbi:ExbD/TolR family protein [Ulvibacter antarcticus]|uniref:Biopolymer transport protein ExbD n=1 Tax=Ulvibacter antarcticus TaxID=442714 RepID=A0A3L9Z224_9FLAO|nr:biopolymer transporter ExbD [Ulvibacter antarcticus]RMA64408.1 biopolymer transport protein ExbD [Ulvibacter antarcticus]
MRYSDKAPEVNAGSMADIAFLLLIFFLVTTTIPNDKGIARKIPPPCPAGIDCNMKLKERNVLRILVNEKDEIMVNNKLTDLMELNETLKVFIDNNGDSSCNYCSGSKLDTSSENPNEATITVNADRNSSYETYIAIQDELTRAYFELRENYVKEVLKTSTAALSSKDIEKVQKAYPFRITEASTQ